MLKTINKKFFSENKALLLLIFLGFLFRVVGINNGYPYIFNIDEPTIIRSAFGLREGFRIDHFDWPHFPFYFNYFFYFIFIKLRSVVQVLNLRFLFESWFPLLWNDPYVFYYITRLLNAVFGALTAIPIFLLAKSAFDSRRIATISAAVYALLPYTIFISKFAVPDTLLLFFVTFALYYSYKYAETFSLKDLIWAAVMYGIASGIKYNAIILSLSLVLFIFNRLKSNGDFNLIQIRKQIYRLIIFGIVSLVAFVATTPSIITDWDIFWSYEAGRGFLWQLTINSNPLEWSEYLPALAERMYQMTQDFGVIPFLLFIYATVVVILNKNIPTKLKWDILIMFAVTLAFILFTNRYARAGSHYFISIYGFIVVLSAWGINNITNITKTKILFYVTIVLLTVWSSYINYEFLVEDTRSKALAYYENVKAQEESEVYFNGENLSEIQMINNLSMRRYRDNSSLNPGDVLLSEKNLGNGDKMELIETIDNSHRTGPIIYVYKKSN